MPTPGSPETENLPPFQLYKLDEDPVESKNLLDAYPEVVEELSELLKSYIENGRSTAGPRMPYVNSENWPGLTWMLE